MFSKTENSSLYLTASICYADKASSRLRVDKCSLLWFEVWWDEKGREGKYLKSLQKGKPCFETGNQMLHRWNFQEKNAKHQELSTVFYPQGSLLSYLFFWLLQTSWQPELSKHLCYTGGILIWGLVQQKTSKMEMEITICSFAASSGYKKWVFKTSSLARDRTISGSPTCKCAAKEVENEKQRFSRPDPSCWALIHS